MKRINAQNRLEQHSLIKTFKPQQNFKLVSSRGIRLERKKRQIEFWKTREEKFKGHFFLEQFCLGDKN